MELYIISLKELKKQSRKIKRKEWNQIAKRKNLLSAYSIEHIAKKSIRQIMLGNS